MFSFIDPPPLPPRNVSFFLLSLFCSLQASDGLLAEAKDAAENMEGRLFESSRRAQEAEAAWEVEREILSQTNESAQVSR